MQLNDMKTVCSFWVLCVRFIRQSQGSIHLELVAAPEAGQFWAPSGAMRIQSSYSLTCNSSLWNRHSFLYFIQVGSSLSFAHFHNCMHQSGLSYRRPRTLYRSVELYLCVHLSSLILSHVTLSSDFSVLEIFQALPAFSFPESQTRNA